MRIALVIAGALTLALAGGSRVHADSFENQMSLQRNDLRNEYRKVSRDLAEVEHELRAFDDDTTTVTGTASGVLAVRTSIRDQAQKLTSRRNQLRQRHDAIEREFRQLTTRIEQHYGNVPIWWGDLDTD